MKKNAIFLVAASSAVALGFVVGYGVGKETRAATPSNVKTEFGGGVLTIKADVTSALKQGAASFLSDL